MSRMPSEKEFILAPSPYDSAAVTPAAPSSPMTSAWRRMLEATRTIRAEWRARSELRRLYRHAGRYPGLLHDIGVGDGAAERAVRCGR